MGVTTTPVLVVGRVAVCLVLVVLIVFSPSLPLLDPQSLALSQEGAKGLT